jgi:hypothetical protein
MVRRVVWKKFTDVSEVIAASIVWTIMSTGGAFRWGEAVGV